MRFGKFSITELVYLLFVRLPHYISGRFIHKNLVKVHWGRSLRNFGDCLQPYILKYYGLTPFYVTSNEKADVLLAGSILQWISSDFSGYIIGTGGIKAKYTFPKAKVLALRGKLTYQNIGITQKCVLGDPGLIMSKIFPEKVEKIYDLGIVPHFTDAENTSFTRLAAYSGVIIIDVLQSPKMVIRQIKQCRHIVSSSLHGLIIAEAFMIPTLRVVDYNTFYWNDADYKYDDYYSALDMKVATHIMTGQETKEELIRCATLKPVDKIREIQESLDITLKYFASMVRNKRL